jgi:hypothetical protein
LARAKADLDIAALHRPPVIDVTAHLLLATQRFVDEQTIACTEWPTTEEVAAFVSQEARKFAKAGHAWRPNPGGWRRTSTRRCVLACGEKPSSKAHRGCLPGGGRTSTSPGCHESPVRFV